MIVKEVDLHTKHLTERINPQGTVLSPPLTGRRKEKACCGHQDTNQIVSKTEQSQETQAPTELETAPLGEQYKFHMWFSKKEFNIVFRIFRLSLTEPGTHPFR